MKKRIISVLLLFFLTCVTQVSFAATKKPTSLKLIFPDRTLTLNFIAQPNLLTRESTYVWNVAGQDIPLDFSESLPPELAELEIETRFKNVISRPRLEAFFAATSLLQMETTTPIEIRLDAEGNVRFEGSPQTGFAVDFEALVPLINEAIDQGYAYVRVPAEKTFSPVVVAPELEARGIKEVLAVGESNFTGSSPERRQNIWAGARKFNGVILKQGERFSFNEILESVKPEDGFVEELVIKGNDTEKEFGGGVCQISTTVYRAAFSGGFPIDQRRNHSYAVPYYKPYGLDATIYLGGQDFKFTNDTPADLLIQAFMEGDNLYFVFYGTADGRTVALEGPFISGYQPAPDPIIEDSVLLPPGEMAELSPAHDGFRAEWVRQVQYPTYRTNERFVSIYRPWAARILRGSDESFFSLQNSPFATDVKDVKID